MGANRVAAGSVLRLLAGVLLLVAALALMWERWPRQAPPTPASEGEQQPAPRQVVIVAVGDVMLDRGVGGKIRQHGAGHVFARVKQALADGDVRFCNLEAPLSATGPHAPHQLIFRASPAAVGSLTDAGFDVVSLANNHTMNAGREGLQNTMSLLARHGIAFAGAAWREGGDVHPTTLRVNDLRLRFLAFTSIGRGDAHVSPEDPSAALAQVRAARREADVLVVSVHWGVEYKRRPSQWQREFAHRLVEAGADVVLGHHPHVLQGVEVLDGKLILYSMGNFVFDQRGRERMESAIFNIRHDDVDGLSVRVRPVWIPRATFAPELCDAEMGARILERMRGLCEDLGTAMRVEGDTGVIEARAEG